MSDFQHPSASNAAFHGGMPGYGQNQSPGGGHPSQGYGANWGANWSSNGPQPGMAMPPYQSQSPWLNFSNDRFIKGALIGAAAAYLLTNESVQRTLIKSAVRTWSLVQSSVEEVKERFQDAEAEIQAETTDKS